MLYNLNLNSNELLIYCTLTITLTYSEVLSEPGIMIRPYVLRCLVVVTVKFYETFVKHCNM